MRVRHAGLSLLAQPALEDDRLAKAALGPRRWIFEALEIGRRGEHGRRIELVGREIFPGAAWHIGDPALHRAKPGNREPLCEVLLVVPGVELLLHRGRRLGQREQETAL